VVGHGAGGGGGVNFRHLPASHIDDHLFDPFYQGIKEGRGMRAIQGILSTLVGMLVLMTLQLGRASPVDPQSWALMAGAALALIAFRINLPGWWLR
jgi:hypothetical protein